MKIDNLLEIGDFFDYSLTLVNLELADQPLVYVNQAFLELTQYTKKEVLGKNCRFLQGPMTDRGDVQFIKNSIADNRSIFIDLLNYKKDGDWFFNRLILLPALLHGNRHYIGLQIDSTEVFQRSPKFFYDHKKAHSLTERILPQMQEIETLAAQISSPTEALEAIKPQIDHIRDLAQNTY